MREPWVLCIHRLVPSIIQLRDLCKSEQSCTRTDEMTAAVGHGHVSKIRAVEPYRIFEIENEPVAHKRSFNCYLTYEHLKCKKVWLKYIWMN